MKKEIVYTDKYALIISDEYIKKCYNWNNFELSDFSESMDVILAHLPLSDAPILEGVPLLPSLLQGEEKYKYTEEDVRKAISLTRDGVLGVDEIIQSLQQSSRPTHFVCEMEYDYRHNDDGERIGLPVHPTNKIKTTTNSQGQVELVGKYI